MYIDVLIVPVKSTQQCKLKVGGKQCRVQLVGVDYTTFNTGKHNKEMNKTKDESMTWGMNEHTNPVAGSKGNTDNELNNNLLFQVRSLDHRLWVVISS